MKETLAGLSATAMILGGIDVSVLDEEKIKATQTVKDETVKVEQVGNTVIATTTWKGEDGLVFKYDMGEPTLDEKFNDQRKQEILTEVVDWKEGISTTTNGAFKMDIILYEKPATSTFCYSIENWEDYEFLRQPPLYEEPWPEEIFGKVSCTATECRNTKGDIAAQRPEEMVGGYYVKHKTNKNTEQHGTGKVGDIPYAYIWEINNATATKQRAESFTIENGNMCVTAQQDFLDTADYSNGVRIDPTFGYNTIGSASTGILANYISWWDGGYSPSSNCTMDDFYIYVQLDNTTNVEGAIYEKTGDLTGTLVATTSDITGATGSLVTQWYSGAFTSSPEVSSGNTYMFTYNKDTSVTIWYDTNVGDNNAYEFSNYGTWLSSLSGIVDSTREFSMYGTCTATGGGGGDVEGETFWDDF